MGAQQSTTLAKKLNGMAANIRQKPDAGGLETLCRRERTGIVAGLLAYRALLEAMYSDAQHLEGKDDDARIKVLLETIALLYSCAVFGDLRRRKSGPTLVVEKQSLLSRYRKGGFTRKAQLLRVHGFHAGWTDARGDSVPESKADAFSIAFPGDQSLIPAIKRLAARIERIEPTDSGRPGTPHTSFSADYMTGKLDLFGMADFAVAFGGASIAPDSVDPLREEVLAMVGTHRSSWERLARKLLGDCGLRCFGRNYVFGHWTISFHQSGKRPFLICSIQYDEVRVQLTVPVHAAEAVIKQRRQYSPTMRRGLEGFRCVSCPKRCRGKNLVEIDGLTICTGRAEGRRIYTGALGEDDFRSIEAIAELAFVPTGNCAASGTVPTALA